MKDSMPNELIEFWQNCPLDKAPFVHPDDRIFLEKRECLIEGALDFDTYITGKRFKPDDSELHLSLLPVPYLGDLRKAEIVVLLLNPGFGYSDYWAEYHRPEFRKRLKENLHQSFDGTEFPFLFLDPQFCWHGGFIWWEKKLRKVIEKIATHREVNYREGLRDLSSKLACVELFPYHSSSFRDHQLIQDLPSVKVACEFAKKVLVPKTESRKLTVIMTRGNWGVPKEKENSHLKIYGGGHTRGAHLSPESPGGEAMLRHYDIPVSKEQ